MDIPCRRSLQFSRFSLPHSLFFWSLVSCTKSLEQGGIADAFRLLDTLCESRKG